MRADKTTWVWGVIWGLGLLAGMGILILYAWIPADGATGDLESFAPEGFRVQWLLEPREGGLQVGDTIVRAGGYTVEEWLGGVPQGTREAWRSGATVIYEVVRDGQPFTLLVTLAPVSFRSILVRWGIQLLVALVFVCIGTLVFWKRPLEVPARALMLFCLATALQYLGDAYNFQFGIVPWRWPLWLQVAYEHVTYSLSIASICYFVLIFPRPHLYAQRFPRLLPSVLYGSHLVAIGGAMLLAASATRALQMGNNASWAIAMTQVAIAVLAGIRSIYAARDPVTRAQMRWIVWTAVVGVAVLVPGYVLPLVFWGHPLLSHPATMVMIAALPIVLAIVILRYRLFDIELIINRSLVYGTLTVLLIGLYLVLVRVLTVVVQLVLRRPNDTLVVFIATLSIALAFAPLRRQVQNWIDRAFYRTKVDYERLLPEVSDRLAKSILLDQLASLLTGELPQRLQVAGADLAVLDLPGEQFVPVGDGALPTLPANHAGIEYLHHLGRPLSRLQPPPDIPADLNSFLDESQIELLVPLISGTELVGVYALLAKMSGNAYNRHDMHFLRILGQQAATSVQNARLYQQVQAYSHTLEDQVRQRTRQLEVAYRELAAQHATLDVVLRNMADGLVVTDLEGRIILFNSVFAGMVAYEPYEMAVWDGTDRSRLVGAKLSQLLPDEALTGALSRAQQAPLQAITVDVGWANQVYQASACALGGADDPVSGVVTVLRDVTQEAEIARMKDDFVSMVSHELRTPLTSMIGFAHVIRMRLTQDRSALFAPDGEKGYAAPARILDELQVIIDQGERLARLVSNVLDLSKIEAGRVEWKTEPVDVADIVHSGLSAVYPLAQAKGIVVVNETEDLLPNLNADRDRLIQVVTNLLSNAIKYTDEGEVRIKAWHLEPGEDIPPYAIRQPNVKLRFPTNGPLVAVSVTDTGTGIAQEDLVHVFERFRQVGERDNGTRRPGTGLGLYICKEIVEQHGGQIWVESALGKGSRFVFTVHGVPS